MGLGNAHAVLKDLGAKGKLDVICHAITPLF
jgi:tRNA pseudouridine-54 N-methylase